MADSCWQNAGAKSTRAKKINLVAQHLALSRVAPRSSFSAGHAGHDDDDACYCVSLMLSRKSCFTHSFESSRFVAFSGKPSSSSEGSSTGSAHCSRKKRRSASPVMGCWVTSRAALSRSSSAEAFAADSFQNHNSAHATKHRASSSNVCHRDAPSATV